MLNQAIVSLRRRERGFTLAEILVTTAIFAIIMLAALAVYDRSNQTFKTSTEAADMQQSTRIGFDKLVSDVRMAGFDYSRGGVPTNGWEAQQPDEQIEYAGPTSLVFRANFNYNSGTATDNGLEPAYTPHNTAGQAIFPFVTTSNSEIVAYVLRSATTNSSTISFYVDDYIPRAVFPNNIVPGPAGANPSQNEALVTIQGIDTTNANPPYTLYRVTLADGNCNGPCTINVGTVGTPVAENIRSMNFQYYTDLNGAVLLTDSAGAQIPSGCTTACTGAIGGAGQYTNQNVGSSTNFADRAQRAVIQSVRVSLTGMNSSRDLQGYTNPTETIPAIQNFRQYALSSLVVPRNLGKTGFPEPVYNVPGPPTITGVCAGNCGSPILYWTAPTGGGPVVQYQLETAATAAGPFVSLTPAINDPTLTSYSIPDDGASDVSQVRYYRLIASNDNGPGQPSLPISVTPQNSTRPMPVSGLTATGGTNNITLGWTAPSTNDPAHSTLSCSGTGGSTNGTAIVGETLKYQVWRGVTANFDPTASCSTADCGVMLVDFSDNPPSLTGGGTPGTTVAFVDSAAANSGSRFPPANCKTYYYRVRVADRCYRQPNWNVGNVTANSISDFFPALGSPAIAGSGSSTVVPTAPASLTIDRTTPNATGCPDPQNLASTNCRITLNWAKVTSDTAGTAVAVDSYRITRQVRVQGIGAPWVPDPLMGPSGQLTVTCSAGTCPNTSFTQQSGGVLTYVDFPQVNDNPGVGGRPLEYQYTVAALGCQPPPPVQSVPSPQPNDPYSAESNAVQYPGCSLNPAIVEIDGQTHVPSAGGDTPLNPWVMNSGDTVNVTPAPLTSIASVEFQTTVYPSGAPLSDQVLNAPNNGTSYTMTWSDQVAGQLYMLRIIVTNAAGCSEIHVKYIQDQMPAPCAFANQTAPVPGAPGRAGNTAILTQQVIGTNFGTDPMQIKSEQLVLTWDRPVGDLNHADLQLVNITIQSALTSTSCNFTQVWASSPMSATCTLSNLMTNVPASTGTFNITMTWNYDRREDPPTITVSPITKLCLAYVIQSEPTVTKKCNIVGQSATTNNPTSCD